jgi:cell wall-associated NlpC family hydrolase
MMNKKIAIACTILTLAGCTASTATALGQKPADATTKVVYKDVRTDLIKSHKEQKQRSKKLLQKHKNTAQMYKVINYLKTRVGKTTYVFSGASPRGWDCSGLVRWTYQRFGMELPHSANKQGHIGKRVHTPKLGDIVVFAYKGSTSFYHSAIYIGNGKIINAHRGAQSTIIQPLTDYSSGQIRFIRVIPTI